VTLDGTLAISVASGFVPAPGSTYEVISYTGNRSGIFSAIETSPFSPMFVASYGTSGLTLTTL
jgi:hypothetical protein